MYLLDNQSRWGQIQSTCFRWPRRGLHPTWSHKRR